MKRMQRVFIVGIAILVIALVTAGAVLASPPRQGPVVPRQSSGGGSPNGPNQPGEQPKLSTPPSFSWPAGVTLPEGVQQPAGVAGPAGQDNRPGVEGNAIQAVPVGQVSYQGKLLQGGNPYNGNIAITFRLYYSDTAPVASAWWEETQTVNVQNGLFNVMLGAVDPIDVVAFYNQQWLGIQPAGAADELAPRQLLSATPYAMSLIPGATMFDDSAPGGYNSSFYVDSTNHNAIYAESDYTDGYGLRSYGYGDGGTGVYGEGDLYGVRGYGPYGVYGVSIAPFGAGVYGENTTAGWGVLGNGVIGVMGMTSETGGTGVFGSGSYTETIGVYGSSSGAGGKGVYGTVSDGSDMATSAGVWGEVTSGVGVGVHGHKGGVSGIGVKGTNVGTEGSGVSGTSSNYIGVWGDTGVADSNYGLYTPDNLYSANYHLAGAIMQLAQNSGSETLEPGDVVVFSGIGAPLQNGVPVVQVARATAANSTAVAGVVYSGFNVAVADGSLDAAGTGLDAGFQVTIPGPVAPGEYLLIVIQGPAVVKVDATGSSIQAGDLLSSAANAGYAARAAEVELSGVRMAAPGTVFGKALEPLSAGVKTIYVFVTLQ